MICQTAPKAMHQTNLTQCLQCVITYCQSCIWGCPRCGLGRDVDRRSSVREEVNLPMDIRLKEEE